MIMMIFVFYLMILECLSLVYVLLLFRMFSYFIKILYFWVNDEKEIIVFDFEMWFEYGEKIC